VTGRAATAPLLYPVIDADTLVAHLVSEDAMSAGRRKGCFHAECGAPVRAASLTVEERSSCRSCARSQHERTPQ
jgi:aerobic-type carbon monoxide dehydrogenase small subunit (CoxS/CutS family)